MSSSIIDKKTPQFIMYIYEIYTYNKSGDLLFLYCLQIIVRKKNQKWIFHVSKYLCISFAIQPLCVNMNGYSMGLFWWLKKVGKKEK